VLTLIQGYSLFKISHELDTVAQRLKETQDTINDLARFGKTVSVVSFLPFESGAAALKELHDISEGQCSDALKAFLDGGLPKAGKKSKVVLGVSDKVLAGSIKSALQNAGLEMQTAETSEVVGDMLRGVRLHGEKLLKERVDLILFYEQWD
jgi:nucleolar protein 56